MTAKTRSPKSTTVTHPVVAPPVSPDTPAHCVELVRPEMDALADTQLAIVNLDIPLAVSIAILAYPNILARRADFAALPGFDVRNVDEMETRAVALLETHDRWLVATAPAVIDATALAHGISTRDQLNTLVTLLVGYGLLAADKIPGLSTGHGYEDCGNDLRVLAHLLAEHWDTIANRVPVTREQIEEARTLGMRLVSFVLQRDQPAPSAVEAARDRQRAFTVFVNGYDQLRRGASYLCWNQGNADTLVPSIYTRPATSPKSKAIDPTPPTATGTTGSSANSTATATSTNSAPAATKSHAVEIPATPAATLAAMSQPVAPGTTVPQDNPFETQT